jgi:hypothetical protein
MAKKKTQSQTESQQIRTDKPSNNPPLKLTRREREKSQRGEKSIEAEKERKRRRRSAPMENTASQSGKAAREIT